MKEIIIPSGWTYLIHGSNIKRWENDPTTIETFVTNNELSCVDGRRAEYDYEQGKHSGANYYTAKSYGSGEGNFQIRVLIYKDILRNKDLDDIKERLSQEEINDIAKYHWLNSFEGRHACVPKNVELLKIGQSNYDNIDNTEGNNIYWFVPLKYLEKYKNDLLKYIPENKGRNLI